jgi:hypothetical protein
MQEQRFNEADCHAVIGRLRTVLQQLTELSATAALLAWQYLGWPSNRFPGGPASPGASAASTWTDASGGPPHSTSQIHSVSRRDCRIQGSKGTLTSFLDIRTLLSCWCRWGCGCPGCMAPKVLCTLESGWCPLGAQVLCDQTVLPARQAQVVSKVFRESVK